ncbi:MAG: hypothetical protein AABY22_18265 [Nanoarchaeota archaeon]
MSNQKFREVHAKLCPLCHNKMYYQARKCRTCFRKNTKRWGKIRHDRKL